MAVLLIIVEQLSMEIAGCDAAVLTSEVSPNPSFSAASLALLVESQAVEIWAVSDQSPARVPCKFQRSWSLGSPAKLQPLPFNTPGSLLLSRGD